MLYHNGTGAQKALQLTATTSPKGSKYRSLTWSVESGDAAAVDANGLVTAVKDGTAVVRAKTDNGRTADCTVTVRTLPTTLALKTTETTLAFKQSFNLGAEVLMDGTEPALTWTTSNKKVATVSSTGVVKASKNKAGNATITATTKNGFKAACNIMVKSLPKGDASPLVTAPNISLRLTGGDYATSDDRVADVNKDGEVTLKQDGEVTLEAGGEQILVQAENGSPVELRLNAGVKLTLLSHEPVEWRVEDERVVTIDRDGQLTALVEGTTTAACTGESGWTLEIRITVSATGDGLPLPGLTTGAEPGPSLEPTAAPEPAMTAEPTAAPEPTTAPEPTAEPAAEPAAAPEPTTAPEPAAPHEDAPPVPEPAPDAPSDAQEDSSDAG